MAHSAWSHIARDTLQDGKLGFLYSDGPLVRQLNLRHRWEARRFAVALVVILQ